MAILLAVGGAVMAVMAMKSEAAKMTADQIATIKKNVYVLPKADRVTKWRELAQQTAEYELQQEALMQLGWEGDKNAIPIAPSARSQRMPPCSVPIGFECCSPASSRIVHLPSPKLRRSKPISSATGGGIFKASPLNG